MKVTILSKRNFDKYMESLGFDDSNIEAQDVLIISINSHYNSDTYDETYDGSMIRSYFKRQHSNVLIMHFGDFGEQWINALKLKGPTGIFNDYKASVLYEFIKRNKHKKHAIIHCAAGVSRSGAVGSFINDIYGESYEEFMFRNPKVEPNPYIRKLLYRQYYRDIYKTNINFD